MYSPNPVGRVMRGVSNSRVIATGWPAGRRAACASARLSVRYLVRPAMARSCLGVNEPTVRWWSGRPAHRCRPGRSATSHCCGCSPGCSARYMSAGSHPGPGRNSGAMKFAPRPLEQSGELAGILALRRPDILQVIAAGGRTLAEQGPLRALGRRVCILADGATYCCVSRSSASRSSSARGAYSAAGYSWRPER